MRARPPLTSARLNGARAARPAGLGGLSSLIRLSPRAAGSAMRLWAGATALALRPRTSFGTDAPPTWLGPRFADSEQR